MTKPEPTTVHYLDYVDRYLEAASYIPESSGELLHPRMQLYGHALELALKAYILSTGATHSRIHNLETLLNTAIDRGLSVSEDQKSSVIPKLNTIYFRADAVDWNFPSRYPENRIGVWVTPNVDTIRRTVISICEQSRDSSADDSN